MRTLLTFALPLAVAVPALTLTPVALPRPTARAVPPQVAHMPLAGVDDGALAELVAAQPPVAPTTRLLQPGQIRPEDSLAAAPPRMLSPRLTGRRQFQTLGVTWDGGQQVGQVTVSFRTHRARGGWTGWTALEGQDGEAAPAADQRGGTEPAWVGPSDGVQVRLDGPGAPPRGLRVDLVDAGSSPFDAYAGTAAPGTAAAMAARPRVLTRADWGADESRVRSPPTLMSTIRAGMIHHTVDTNGYSAGQVPAIIRGDYAYHLSRGWNDIGYNFLVDRFGRTWEGRAGGITNAVMGAHSGGFNSDTFGVAILGNYELVRPSASSIAAVQRLFAWKLDLYHRDPRGSTLLTSAGGGTSRYPAGTTVRKPVVMGHRDVGQTDCPGRYVYALLPQIRLAVARSIGAALFEPTRPAATVAYASPARISATANLRQGWQLDVTRTCPAQPAAKLRGTAAARSRFTATWNGRTSTGAPARPGGYSLLLSSSGSGSTARGYSARTTVFPPPPAAPPAAVAATGAGGYQPVAPVRLLDTRSGPVLAAGPGGRVDLPVLGRGGIPSSGVTSVVLAASATCGTASTVLSAWPTGRSRPGTSLLVAPGGSTVTSLTAVAVGANGSISLGTTAGVTDLVVDVVGYHGTGGAGLLKPVAATRVFDTATDAGGALVPGADRQVTLPALAGVNAAQLTAVVANLVVTGPTTAGHVTGYAQGSTAPATSSVTVQPGRDTVARAVIGVHQGKLMLRAIKGSYRVAVDVVGVYAPGIAGGQFTAVTGTRLLDTRVGSTAVPSGGSRSLTVAGGAGGVPNGAGAVLLAVTAVAPAAGTSVSVGPAGGAAPAVPDLKAAGRQIAGNVVLVAPGAGGAVTIRNSGSATHLVVDLVGYYG